MHSKPGLYSRATGNGRQLPRDYRIEGVASSDDAHHLKPAAVETTLEMLGAVICCRKQ
jgi:hypothetical protein